MPSSGLTPNLVTTCALVTALAARGGRQRAGAAAWPAWAADPAAVVVGMNAAVEAGDTAAARGVLERAVKAGAGVSVEAYNVLLKGSPAASIPGLRAEMVAARVPPNGVTFNSMVASHAKEGDIPSARAALALALAAGHGRDGWAHAALAAALVRAGRLEDAEALVGDAKGVGARLGVEFWTALVDGAARARGPAAAASVVARMRDQEGVSPNAVTFNALLRAHCAPPPRVDGEGGADGAPSRPTKSALAGVLATLASMGASGVRPGVDTYNTLMAGALARGAPSAVPRLFRAARAAGRAPDVLSWTTLIAALARLGRPDDAVAAFSAMESSSRLTVADGPALAALVDALARSPAAVPAARAVLTRAAALAAAAGLPPPADAYGAAVAASARAGDALGAAALAVEFAAAGGDPDARMIAALAGACRRGRDARAAVAALRSAAALAPPRARPALARAARAVAEAAETSGDKDGLERLKFWLGLPNTLYGDEGENSDGGRGAAPAPMLAPAPARVVKDPEQ